MEKSSSELHIDGDGYYSREHSSIFRCTGCNEKFEKPLLATLSSGGYTQTYYACPRCLSKISNVKHQRSEETREATVSSENIRKRMAKSEESVKCTHFLGYLKKHPKDEAFPEECLTCDRMIECMLH